MNPTPTPPPAPLLAPPAARLRIAEMARMAWMTCAAARTVAHHQTALPRRATRADLCFGAEGIASYAVEVARVALPDAARSSDPEQPFRALVREVLDAHEAAETVARRVRDAR